MAIYRQIHTCFWEDTKILDEMEFTDRYFYLYLLTNPHVNQSGCYEISISQIVNECGIDKKQVLDLLEKFENKFKIIKYSSKTKELLITNFYKYNWTTSPKVKICIEKEISKIKSQELIGYIKGIFKKVYPMDTHTQEKEKEKEKEKKKKEEVEEEKTKVAHATSPTPPYFNFSSILEYGQNKGATKEYCKKFYDYYFEKNKKWQTEKEWQKKFDEWCLEDKIEKNGNDFKKIEEGVYVL